MNDILTKGDLIVVYWEDAIEDISWTSLKTVESQKVPLCKNVGWFINEDKDCVRLSNSIMCDEKELDVGYSIFPKGIIINIEKIQDDELEVE